MPAEPRHDPSRRCFDPRAGRDGHGRRHGLRHAAGGRILAAVLVACGLVGACAATGAAEIVLSPGGPIATPEAARDAARAAARRAEKPVRIVVADGTYRLTAPLALTADDSGTEWVAAEAARPVFSGGEPVTGWRERDGLWVAPLPAAKEGRRFEQLWVNGRRAVRARHPNRGFLHLRGPVPAGAFADEAFTAKGAEITKLGFRLDPADYALLAAIPAPERDGLLVTVTHDWSVSQTRLAALDDATRSVRIRGRARYPLAGGGDPAPRFFLENTRAALDEAGEWHLDVGAGELLYKPLPGERPDAVEAIVPVAPRLVTLSDVRDVVFRGIEFRHDDDRYPADGLFEGQAAPGIGAAIEVTASRGIRFEGCTVAHVGRHAIHFRNGCADSAIVHCRLEDLGGGGVVVGETARPVHEAVCERIVIDDCIIRQGGRRHPSACGVTFTHTRACAVTHCDIGDLSSTGVSAGWNWGYGESMSRETRVENNRIHHLGWGYLSDMGGFYGLGTSPGTVIRGNHIHHVQSHRYGGWGIYYDEGSCDCLAENNLVHDTSDTGFHQHYGYANRVRNNILAFGRRAQVHRTRNEPRLCFIFERNIVVWDPPATLLDRGDASWATNPNPSKGEPADTIIFRDNLYWCTDGTVPGPLNAGAITWDSWRKLGRDRGSLFADPLFVDAAARDFRLRPGSPAAKIGFTPWEIGRAGVREADAAWRAEAARGHVMPDWDRDSRPWPAPAFAVRLETFDAEPPGTLGIPRASWARRPGEPDRGESIGVSDRADSPLAAPAPGAADGNANAAARPAPGRGRSLEFQDAPGLARSFEPTLDILTDWPAGRFTAAFDVMAQPDADWFFEMREKGGEFAAGPIVWWRGGRLLAGKDAATPLAEVPPGEWCRVTITAAGGAGSFAVAVERQDGTRREAPAVPCSPAWKAAGHLLFSGQGTSKAAFYVDNLRLERADE